MAAVYLSSSPSIGMPRSCNQDTFSDVQMRALRLRTSGPCELTWDAELQDHRFEAKVGGRHVREPLNQ
jgi:hypothetical protein